MTGREYHEQQALKFRSRAIGTILNVLQSPISLMSHPTREEALELAVRFEVTAAELLEWAAGRARGA